MGRLPQGVHLRPNKKGYYKRILLDELDKTGRHKRYTVYGKTVAEVQNKEIEINEEILNGTFMTKREKRKMLAEQQEMATLLGQQKTAKQKNIEELEPDSVKLGEWYEYWLNQYKAQILKDYTLSTYRGYLRNYLMVKPNPSKPPTARANMIAAYHLGDYPLKNISGLLLQDFYNTCINTGLKPQSVKKVAGAISECLLKSKLLGMIPQNPADIVELPKTEKSERVVLNREEILLFLKYMHDARDPLENCVGVMMCSGLRVSENMGLSWNNVNFEEQTITVCQQLQRRKHTEDSKTVYTLVPSTKNGKSRTIYAPHICFEYLRAEKKRQKHWAEVLCECYDNKYNLCFTYPDGSNISQSSITSCVKKYGKAIGKPTLRVHDLRHSFATMLAADIEIPIATTSAILGHSTVSFTMNTYVHNRDNDKKKTQIEISKLFDNMI